MSNSIDLIMSPWPFFVIKLPPPGRAHLLFGLTRAWRNDCHVKTPQVYARPGCGQSEPYTLPRTASNHRLYCHWNSSLDDSYAEPVSVGLRIRQPGPRRLIIWIW